MALRIAAYDHPNYTLIRSVYIDSQDVASATAFARFRSRASVIVTSITAVVASASSAAKVTFTVERGGSTNTTFTIVSATSAGAMTTVSCAITLTSAQLINLKHDDVGDYQVVYEYRVLPGEGLYDGL